MITIANLPDLADAYLLKSRLESEGLTVFIPDENTAQTQWLWISAIGGIRLQVPEEQVILAKEILNLHRSENAVRSTPACPSCGSDDTRRDTSLKNLALVVLVMVGIPLPFYLRYQCQSCRHKWKQV